MTRSCKRLLSWLLVLAFMLMLSPPAGRAALQGVYFTAANEQLLELNSSTMPFWSGDTLYVSSKLFEGTDLGVKYVRNNKMGLAMLYTSRTDLRFDLVNQKVTDKQGTSYTGQAIERGGVVFFPLNLVCGFFGLTWSYNSTDTAPLIRLRSASAILDDRTFIDAASDQMAARYASYEKWVEENTPASEPPSPPPVHAAEGQRVHLIIESRSAEDTMAALTLLDRAQATFLLPLELMHNGDLVRSLVCGGHEIALLSTAETASELEAQVNAGREALWQHACTWLRLVWISRENAPPFPVEDLGCQVVTAMVDHSDKDLSSSWRARNLFQVIGRYREDVTVFLGSDINALGGLSILKSDLLEAQYNVCAWRLTAS